MPCTSPVAARDCNNRPTETALTTDEEALDVRPVEDRVLQQGALLHQHACTNPVVNWFDQNGFEDPVVQPSVLRAVIVDTFHN